MNNDKPTKGEVGEALGGLLILCTMISALILILYGSYYLIGGLINQTLFVEEGDTKEFETHTTTCDDIKRPPFILQCIKNANQSVDDPEDSVYSCSQLGDKLFCETTYETQTFKYTDNQWRLYE